MLPVQHALSSQNPHGTLPTVWTGARPQELLEVTERAGGETGLSPVLPGPFLAGSERPGELLRFPEQPSAVVGEVAAQQAGPRGLSEEEAWLRGDSVEGPWGMAFLSV